MNEKFPGPKPQIAKLENRESLIDVVEASIEDVTLAKAYQAYFEKNREQLEQYGLGQLLDLTMGGPLSFLQSSSIVDIFGARHGERKAWEAIFEKSDDPDDQIMVEGFENNRLAKNKQLSVLYLGSLLLRNINSQLDSDFRFRNADELSGIEVQSEEIMQKIELQYNGKEEDYDPNVRAEIVESIIQLSKRIAAFVNHHFEMILEQNMEIKM